MTKLTHSFSSIKMYDNCPKRYYHQRIAKEVEDTGSVATIYGERVHSSIEKRIVNGDKLSEETKEYESICQQILDSNVRLDSSLHIEQKLCLDENFNGTEWMSKNAWFRSILDVLVINKDKDIAVVMDWKTGKRRPDFMQLELFAMQVFFHFRTVNKVISSFLWLKDMRTDSKIFTRENDLQNITSRFLRKLKSINNSLTKNEWIPKPSGLCRFCPCKDFCEFAQK